MPRLVLNISFIILAHAVVDQLVPDEDPVFMLQRRAAVRSFSGCDGIDCDVEVKRGDTLHNASTAVARSMSSDPTENVTADDYPQAYTLMQVGSETQAESDEATSDFWSFVASATDALSSNETSSSGAAQDVTISLQEAYLEPEAEQLTQEEPQYEAGFSADQGQVAELASEDAASEADALGGEAPSGLREAHLESEAEQDADKMVDQVLNATALEPTAAPTDEKAVARSLDSVMDLPQDDADVVDASAVAVQKGVSLLAVESDSDLLVAERRFSSKVLLIASSLLLGLAAFMLLACCMVVCGTTEIDMGSTSTSPSGAFVEMLKTCSKADLDRLLPEAPMDCAHHRPWSSGGPVRLEGRIDKPSGGALESPLTKRPCVLFSAGVSQRTHDGMHPVSVAFAQNYVSFEVSLLDAPDMRIHVKGDDVLLFDLEDGRHIATSAFDVAPEHWQTFALTRRNLNEHGGNTVLQYSRNFEGCELDFQECALLVGARVTIVGELHRRADGRFMLQPWHDTASPATQKASVTTAHNKRSRTIWHYLMSDAVKMDVATTLKTRQWRWSWEKASGPDQQEGAPPTSKVLVSDRSAFLQASAPTCQQELRSPTSLFHRLPQRLADALQSLRVLRPVVGQVGHNSFSKSSLLHVDSEFLYI